MRFAEGDRRQLRSLLSREVYNRLDAAITEREGRGETAETRFVSIDGSTVTAAELRDRTAQITVRFVSKLASSAIIRTSEHFPCERPCLHVVGDLFDIAVDYGPGSVAPHFMLMIDKVRERADDFDILHFHIDLFHFPLFRSLEARTLTTLHSRQDLGDLKPFYYRFGSKSAGMPWWIVAIKFARAKDLRGWLASTAAGAAAGGAAGGIIGALTQTGTSEEDANAYAEGIRRGGTLVSARVPDGDRARYEAILDLSSVNIRDRGSAWRNEGWQKFDPNAGPYTADQVRSTRETYRTQRGGLSR